MIDIEMKLKNDILKYRTITYVCTQTVCVCTPCNHIPHTVIYHKLQTATNINTKKSTWVLTGATINIPRCTLVLNTLGSN